MEGKCVICKQTFQFNDGVTVSRGKKTLSDLSKLRGDELWKTIENSGIIKIHEECRKNYIRESKRRKTVPTMSAQSSDDNACFLRRKSNPDFDFKVKCIFCAEECHARAKNKKNRHFSVVSTLELNEKILTRCKEREDSNSHKILSRICISNDLVAAEARYHRNCMSTFFKPTSEKQETGRPVNSKLQEAFQKLCSFIERNDAVCQFSLDELSQKMCDFLDKSETMWSITYFKEKLLKHFHDKIVVHKVHAKKTIISIREYPNKIITDQWYNEKKLNEIDERKRIIKAAAQIIREDIRGMVYELDNYPSKEDIENGNPANIPSTVSYFLENLAEPKKSKNKKKLICVSNILISLVRPRSYLSPILCGLAVHLHRRYASRELLDLLHSLGICESYNMALDYEASVVTTADINVLNGSFSQFIFDNADINVRTLDGHGTFHSMGGLVAITPKETVNTTNIIPRLKKKQRPSALEIGKFGTAPIISYVNPGKAGLHKIKIKEIVLPETEPNVYQSTVYQSKLTNYLWSCGYFHNIKPAASWQGYMSIKCETKDAHDLSSIIPLPFINLDPGNLTTIYSALQYAADMAKKYKMKTCIVTFDQPLFLKAVEIVAAADHSSPVSNLLIRLGGFHMMMSFMSAIGFIMGGSGLDELWQTVYAKNSVVHMLNGHAYTRAIRAHFLTQAALSHLILKYQNVDDASISEIETLYNVNELPVNLKDTVIENLFCNFDLIKKGLTEKHRTAKLWCNYWDLVELLKLFLKAERLADWNLHLYCVKEMLPIFHAAGHLAYAKSAHLYLQNMLDLPQTMDIREFELFTSKGLFSIRRTNKSWSGTSPDMVIEQELMRRMKTSGGLIHGRGTTDNSLAMWIASMPQCSLLSEAIETFAEVRPQSTDQHVEMKDSRRKRDNVDFHKFYEWLQTYNPFNNELVDLINVFTGVTADVNVNSDRCLEVGQQSLNKIIGKSFRDIKLKRNDRVVSMSNSSTTIKINTREVAINPTILFSRIICAATTTNEIKEAFEYELSPTPTALFNDTFMRKTNKSALLGIFDKVCPPEMTSLTNSHYVIDGGHLLHKVVWSKPSTFSNLYNQYYLYIIYNYGSSVTVVFDGYSNKLCTKSEEHLKRRKNKNTLKVIFNECTITSIPQEDFLRNEENKTLFIKQLGQFLASKKISVLYSDSDADVLIVNEAVKLSEACTTTVVGDDTDLMVLLVHYNFRNNVYMLRPGSVGKPNKLTNIKNLQEKLGGVKEVILALHSISGCDTTSSLFKKGKQTVYNKLNNKEGVNLLKKFYEKNVSKASLCSAGEKILLAIYVKSGNVNSINLLRYILYQNIVVRAKISQQFELSSLPPTLEALTYHFYRTYLQVQQWLGNPLSPLDWGWHQKDADIVPIKSLNKAAPDWITKKIFCNCLSGCGKLCSCRKVGLRCSNACGQCLGITCSNKLEIVDYDDVEDEINL